MQVSVHAYVVCWSSVVPNIYRIALSSLDGTELLSDSTNSTCYLFDNLITDNCCRVRIGYISTDEAQASIEINIKHEARVEGFAYFYSLFFRIFELR